MIDNTDLTLAVQCHALIACAGMGLRAGAQGPKQYAKVAGNTLIGHTLKALAQVSQINQILVVLSPTDTQFERHVPAFKGAVARVGGESRAHSVLNGLGQLLAHGAQRHDWVLVHDAARCLIRPEWVLALIKACWHDPVGGLLALPVADTLKRSNRGCGDSADAGCDERVLSTVERSHVWQAQTPQMFRLGALQAALQTSLYSPLHRADTLTDEASAMQACGHQPKLVMGALENFKITYPADFSLAQRLLSP
jgi:2-C-methyl-D-erythritol 4-phosphate cytidylyltransferase